MYLKEFNILLNLQDNSVEETYVEVLRNDIGVNAFNVVLTDNYQPRNISNTVIYIEFLKADLNTFVQDNVRDRVDTNGKFSIDLENTSYDILGKTVCTVRVYNEELVEMYNKSFIFYVRDSFATPPSYDYNVAIAEIAKILRDSQRADIQLKESITLTMTTLSILNNVILEANEPTTALENGIFLAKNLKNELSEILEQSIVSVHELEALLETIGSASTLDTQLLATIEVANALKVELEALINSGDLSEITSAIETIQLAMDSLHEHDNKNVLDLLTDSNGSLLYNGNQVGVGDMTKIEYDLDGDGKVDSAKHSDTSSFATNAGNASTVGGFTVAKSVPGDAKFTDTTYSSLPANGGNSNTVGGKSPSNFTTRVDLSGQVQQTSYRRSVIALCELTNTNISYDSYSIGTLTFHRTNGISGTATAFIGIEKAYNTTQPRYNSFNILPSGANSIRPCTFMYNGVKYGGIEFFFSDAEYRAVEFYGSTNFSIFGLDYVDTRATVTVPYNAEVNSSLNFTDPILNSQPYFNGSRLWHTGNLTFATQAQAKAGTDNTTIMTPMMVKEAVGEIVSDTLVVNQMTTNNQTIPEVVTPTTLTGTVSAYREVTSDNSGRVVRGFSRRYLVPTAYTSSSSVDASFQTNVTWNCHKIYVGGTRKNLIVEMGLYTTYGTINLEARLYSSTDVLIATTTSTLTDGRSSATLSFDNINITAGTYFVVAGVKSVADGGQYKRRWYTFSGVEGTKSETVTTSTGSGYISTTAYSTGAYANTTPSTYTFKTDYTSASYYVYMAVGYVDNYSSLVYTLIYKPTSLVKYHTYSYLMGINNKADNTLRVDILSGLSNTSMTQYLANVLPNQSIDISGIPPERLVGVKLTFTNSTTNVTSAFNWTEFTSGLLTYKV